MSKRHKVRTSAVLMAVASLASMAGSASAAVLNYDTSAASGVQTGSGIWDLGNTADWTTNGTSLAPWTSNSNTAAVVLAAGSSGGILTVDNSLGQVGANGLVFSGSTGSGGSWQLTGGPLQLGAGGIRHTPTNGVLTINAPLQLTASQTWTNNKSAANVLNFNGPISGNANLTFDGVSAGTGVGDAITFNVGGSNSYTGSTTVTGSATLKLDYTVSNTQKLDPASVLNLNNGKILMVGSAAASFGDTVASTNLGAGQNSINRTGTGAANVLKLGNVSRGAGATLDVNGGLITVSNTNTDGTSAGGGGNHILGGWATAFGGTGWLSAAGANSVATTNGGTFATTSGWTAGSAVKYTGGGSPTIPSNTSANVLQISGTVAAMTVADKLTLVSGGLMNDVSGSSITGGQITTGMSTGELFVYAGTAFTVGSQIADNGTTPTVLVKGAANTLTLTGANTYTGKTYVNAGRLTLGGSAVGTVVGGLSVATNATFDPGGVYTVGVGKTLSGGGTIVNSVDASGATVNPGDSVGALRIQGGLTLDAASLLDFDFNDLSTGAANDSIVLSTAASRALVLDGTLDVDNLGGLAVGKYTLISGATSITDNGLDLNAQGFEGSISQDGANVYLNITAVSVPEPTTMVLMAIPALLLAGRRRRRA